MKKKGIVIALIIVFLPIAGLLGVGIYFKNNVEKSDKMTFEQVFSNPELKKEVGIIGKGDPGDFGYAFSEENFYGGARKIEDFGKIIGDEKRINLNGWFIQSGNPQSDKCIIMIEGRTSNRLKTLKYLKIFREKGIDREYSIFIPDMRNSGKSESSLTYMGFMFGEDVHASIKYVNKNHKKSKFVLYSFSMGAMGAALCTDRYKETLSKEGVEISGMIMDSALSNVRAQLSKQASDMKVPQFITETALFIFNMDVHFSLDKMRLSYLLPNKKVPVLILQSEKDKSTFYSILKEEMKSLEGLVSLKVFKEGEHVRIYPVKENEKRYSDEIENYLKSLR